MKRTISSPCVFIIVILFSAAFVYAASPASLVKKANNLYRQKKYDAAMALYNQILTNGRESDIIQYDKGAAEYQGRDFEKAALSFEESLATQNKVLEQRANFNLGNSRYKLGELKQQADVAQAAQSLQESVNCYKRAIELNPGDADAKFNYELADKLLKELKEKLKTQQQHSEKEQQAKGQGQEQKQQQQAGSQQEKDKQQQEGQSQQQQSESQGQKQPETKQGQGAAGGGDHQEQDHQEMSQQEAKMLLEGYRQEESDIGMLRDRGKPGAEEVLKDW